MANAKRGRRLGGAALFGALVLPLTKERNRKTEEGPIADVQQWNRDHPTRLCSRVQAIGERTENERNSGDGGMMPVNSAPFVPHADDHATPVHDDDICGNEENGKCEDESGSGHNTFTEHSSSAAERSQVRWSDWFGILIPVSSL